MYLCTMELQIRNASANNLKGFDIDIPHHKLVVITGVSGSGKSSLAYDIIANAGQNSFLENIPGFARKFGAKKAELHAEVQNLFPVVAIRQNPGTPSVTSTFGTISEVYDLFRLLFARYGQSEQQALLTRAHFSFNTNEGACEKCRGIGNEEYISVAKLIADENKNLREGALIPTQPNGYTMYSQVTVEAMNEVCEAHGFSVDIPWKELTEAQKDVVLNGSERVKIPFGKHSEASRLNWTGIKAKPREKGFYKGMLPIMEDILKRDRNKNILKFADARECSSCGGERLGVLARAARWNSFSIAYITSWPLEELLKRMNNAVTNKEGEARIVQRIVATLEELVSLGFQSHCLKLSAAELAQGEIQRLRLVNQLRSGLSNMLYVFDEPGAGLHPAYQRVLIDKFKHLVSKGNSVILVEHGKTFIEQADWIVEIGPLAGERGGQVLHNCSFESFIRTAEIAKSPSATQQVFLERKPLMRSRHQEQPKAIEMNGIQLLPARLNVLATDVSAPKLQEILRSIEASGEPFFHVNRKPIGKTPRSNPATYTGLADELRNEFAKLKESKTRGLKKSHFSFNTKGGRCETCEGAGKTVIGMSYLGKIEVTCETCNGKRFKEEVLQVQLEGLSIADMYDLSIEEAHESLKNFPKITSYLEQLIAVGIGYLKLGQSSSTLSGGEAQRLKLATRLFRKEQGWLFLEEPTSGLHEHDLESIIHAFDQLCLAGNTIVAVDYNRRMLDEADHVVELTRSGEVLFQGKGSNLQESNRSELGNVFFHNHRENRAEAKASDSITLQGCTTHNLKGVDVSFRSGAITVVTGKSGSGKSSLVARTLHDLSTSLYLSGLSAYQRSFIANTNQAEVTTYNGLTPTVLLTKQTQTFSDWAIVGTAIKVFEELRYLFSRAAQLEGKNVAASDLNFTSIKGACETCGGKGAIRRSTAQTLVNNWYLSPNEGAFAWSKTLAYYGAPDSRFFALLQAASDKYGVDLSKPMNEMAGNELALVLNGTGEEEYEVTWEYENKTRKGAEQIKGKWEGFIQLIEQEFLLRKNNKNISGLTDLLEVVTCDTCEGKRLSKRNLGFNFGSNTLSDVLAMSISDLHDWIGSPHEKSIEEKLVAQFREGIQAKLTVLLKLDLGYLSLSRSMNSLSGGEAQRVRLAQLLAQPLMGLTVILDEPSSGLGHDLLPALQESITAIKDKGNTVVLVEHDASMIAFADEEIALGPGTGINGGTVVYQGTPRPEDDSYSFEMPLVAVQPEETIQFIGASKWSVKNMNFSIDIGSINHLTGVSGSGKSTLLEEVIIPSLTSGRPMNCESISDSTKFDEIQLLQQSSPRTKGSKSILEHLDLVDKVTRLFASEAKDAGVAMKSSDFDYRKKEGRCQQCGGTGMTGTSLDILEEVWRNCYACDGLRYAPKSQKVRIEEMTIGEVLNLSLGEFESFANRHLKGVYLLTLCSELGLGHINGLQPLKSLSNGELQRLRLALLLQHQDENQLIALDEVSNGLHQEDLAKVLHCLNRAIAKGATLVVIDHHQMVHQWSSNKIKVPNPTRDY